jgi:hypothetical protein
MQVILQEFPQIQLVKCFTAADDSRAVAPGVNVQVVVIPKEKDDGRFITTQPRVSLATLYDVKKFLSGYTSPFARVEVGNAAYEKVKIICKVVFTDSTKADYGFYERKLVQDINYYIAPWLYSVTDDIKMGNRIYKSDILMFIKNRPYVSFVTGFSAVHFFNTKESGSDELKADLIDTAAESLDYIEGSGPGAVLIPSMHHSITAMEKPTSTDPQRSGIGSLIIGDEFLVKEEQKVAGTSQKRKRQIWDDENFNIVITHNING